MPIPIITQVAISIWSYMFKDQLSASAASQMAAAEYAQFRYLHDEAIGALALEMASRTDMIATDWFTILKHARDTAPPPGTEPPPPPPAIPEKPAIPAWFWIIPIVIVGALLIGGRK